MELNPFIINGYEGAEYFCDREQETSQLIREVTNGNNVALVATRRMGKSGLIKHCFQQTEIKDVFYTFYVDVYATRSLSEFVFRLSREILSKLKPFGAKAIQQFWDCVRSLQSGISLSPMGDVSFNVQVGDIVHSENTLDEIFHYLSNADRPCVVAIDEFQQVTNYDDKNVEALLRTYVQQCPSVRFIFSGSQRHLMTQIFQSPSRPFYQSVSMMHLDSIDINKYKEFARRHFELNGKTLQDGVVEAVYIKAKSITWYIQKLMNTLYTSTSVGEECTVDMVENALDYVLQSQGFGYSEQMFRIPDKQRNVLVAIAKDDEVSAVTSGAFIRKHKLSSASTVQSAVRGLLEKDYITQVQGKYSVYDLFLGYWLKKEF